MVGLCFSAPKSCQPDAILSPFRIPLPRLVAALRSAAAATSAFGIFRIAVPASRAVATRLARIGSGASRRASWREGQQQTQDGAYHGTMIADSTLPPRIFTIQRERIIAPNAFCASTSPTTRLPSSSFITTTFKNFAVEGAFNSR